MANEKLYTLSELNAARREGAELGWDACYEYVNWFDAGTPEPPDKETFLPSLPVSEWIRVEEKYKWQQKDGETYIVFHQEGDIKTMIATTESAEKAHLLATACNALDIK